MPSASKIAQFALYALRHPNEAKSIISYKVRSPYLSAVSYPKLTW